MKQSHIKKWATQLAVIALALVFIVACGNKQAEQTVKLGVMGADTDVWDSVKERLADKEGINHEYVQFTDYSQPNRALSEGEIDLNAFQHTDFLNNYNKEFGTDLVSIGNTVIAPMGLYSNDFDKPEAIADNSEIAIPNDVTNGGRALRLLESAGLIKLRNDAPGSPTVDDIAENPHNFKIKELDAAQVSRSLDDVGAAVINSGMADDAGFDPVHDPIYIEPVDENSKPFVNIIAARKEDENNETYQKIVDYYQTEETKGAIKERDQGASVPAWEDYGRK
ncbi:MAG: MetQ/NlpA family ABC transporter substrate-binding protein [Aerococcus sp.]|nr:MetQ/NlpA family ABC transporter substrate-binding protein [Aerococcus sp.]